MNVKNEGSDKEFTSRGESDKLTKARKASCAVAYDALKLYYNFFKVEKTHYLIPAQEF